MPGEDGLSLARHLRERYAKHRDRHADFRRHGRGSDRRPRDGRRRLRPQALRPARARGAREERAAPHVVREPRRHRRGKGAHRTLRARPRRPPAHRRDGRGSGDVAARVRSAEGARGASQPGALARAHPESEPAARLGPVRPQRRSARHAVAQEDRAGSRASAVHQDRYATRATSSCRTEVENRK